MKLKRPLYLKTLLILLFCVLSSDLDAQFYFGRNKIQYDNFEWKILRTEHFEVYFYPEMRELAEIGASFAEEAYHRLEGKMNHNITRRIPLIFYSNHSHFQQTNTIPNVISEGVGGFFEFIKGRVVIPANGSVSAFKHVINHELVHVFTRSKMNRVLKDHRRVNNMGLPLWFTEGIAEYWSTGWDSQAEMIIRDAVLGGHLVPLSRMDTIFGSFLMYKEGQAICKYIAETFGEEKLHHLIENIWKQGYFSDVMKLTIGLNYEEFDEKWTYDLKKNKYPLMEHGDSPKMVSDPITKEGINTKPAFFKKNRDGCVVFVSNRTGYSNIYLKPIEDEDNKIDILVKGERSSDYESFHLLRSKIDVNENGQLAFVAKSGARDAIYIFDIKTKKVIKKLQFDDLVSLSSPSWSPDAKMLVFSGISYSGLSDLYTFEVTSGDLHRLTNDFYDDRDPAWSPDGNAIAFSSDRCYYGKDGKLNIFLYELKNSKIRCLTSSNNNDYSPAWSPDGKHLAFSSDRDGSFNIWLIKNNSHSKQPHFVETVGRYGFLNSLFINNGLHGKNKNASFSDYPSAVEDSDQMRKITNFITGAFDPVWSDNHTILFSAFENFSFQIRKLTDVQDKFKAASKTETDRVVSTKNIWAAQKLAGKIESTTLKYKKKFTLDIAQSSVAQDPVFGVSGGAQLAMSDMLGDQQYYFLVFNNAQTKKRFLGSWNIAVTRIEKSKRVNYAFGGYRLTGRFYDQIDRFFERSQEGGFVAVSYPLSVFRRIEGGLNVRHERREYDTRGVTVNGIVLSNSFSYIKDNSIWGVTGPIDGERFNFSLGHTMDMQNNDVNFYSIIIDYRRYFRVSKRTTFAFRLMTRFNHGKEAYRSFMGGSWDLRLYPRWTIWGRKLFLINNELRFPFIDRFFLGFPFGGLGFNAIRGAVFVDFGQAWDRDYRFNEVLGSLGLGLRVRVGGFLVLRYEIGRKFQIHDFNRPRIHFEKGLRKAFWFGFDF